MIKLTQNLVKEQNILPILRKKNGSCEQRKCWESRFFFLYEKNSRKSANKKDCTKVIINGISHKTKAFIASES